MSKSVCFLSLLFLFIFLFYFIFPPNRRKSGCCPPFLKRKFKNSMGRYILRVIQKHASFDTNLGQLYAESFSSEHINILKKKLSRIDKTYPFHILKARTPFWVMKSLWSGYYCRRGCDLKVLITLLSAHHCCPKGFKCWSRGTLGGRVGVLLPGFQEGGVARKAQSEQAEKINLTCEKRSKMLLGKSWLRDKSHPSHFVQHLGGCVKVQRGQCSCWRMCQWKTSYLCM